MEINETLKDPKYAKAYSETKLLEKIVKFAKAFGINTIYVVLLLFYVLQQSSTPNWAKTLIIGALGYFISPLDAVPDAIPFFGQLDDWALLLAALGAVAIFIEEETKSKAKAKLHVWFGDYDEKELDPVDKKVNDKKESNQSGKFE